MKIENYEVCEENCNAILSSLYIKRDRISNRIDNLISMGYNSERSEEEYNDIVDLIEEICEFRRTHACLTEGDVGFRYC